MTKRPNPPEVFDVPDPGEPPVTHLIQYDKNAAKTPRNGKLDRLMANPDQYKVFIDSIKLGAWYWVSALAAGCTPATVQRWMRLGQKSARQMKGDDDYPDNYARFYCEVTQATAYARMMAEMEVKRGNVLQWLKQGPGRGVGMTVRRGQNPTPGWESPEEEIQRQQSASISGGMAAGPTVTLPATEEHTAEVMSDMAKLGLLTISSEGQQFLAGLLNPPKPNGEHKEAKP